MTNEQAWNFAIGIVQLDGIKPSDELLELVEQQKRGEITNDDIRRELKKKYIWNINQ
ncbi:MAG: antitoxin VbhA family protein [Anaerovorax sp.]|nr:antitoxin VbhA family protein [Anaerovorax sp.]